jgi:dihydrofolate reductase
MEMKPFLNIITAMHETNAIGHENKIPWAPLPTDQYWYLTHTTVTKDPLKRVALILGRLTFNDTILLDKKYTSRWHFIVITRQSPEVFYESCSKIDRNQIDVVNSFDQAASRARELIETPSAMVESVFVFGGVSPYEEALASKLVKRIYLTRVFAEFPQCDARLSSFDLNDFRRIKRSRSEILAELDDKICEENGWKYQFQVYERNDL